MSILNEARAQLLAGEGGEIVVSLQSQSSLLINAQEPHSLAEGEADSDLAYQNIEQLVEIEEDLTYNRGLLISNDLILKEVAVAN